jgi:hypothetical protein
MFDVGCSIAIENRKRTWRSKMRVNLQKGLIAAVLVASSVLAGAVVSTSNRAQGEVRVTPPPVAFQSGGQLSLPLLKEIASTLQQIDARLARLESIAQKLQASGSSN